jgi:hypothetical protein
MMKEFTKKMKDNLINWNNSKIKEEDLKRLDKADDDLEKNQKLWTS